MLNRTGLWRLRVSVVMLLVAGLGAAAGGARSAPSVEAAAPVQPVQPLQPGQASPDDDFYLPPSPLPAGSPGDIIRSRPSLAGPPPTQAMATAWQVMYLSTNVLGEPSAVTGTILVPNGSDPASAPIIGMGPGTQGPAFQCAPSQMINIGAFYEQPAVNDMLARGYAVAVTDYEGYHPDPATTYMIGPSMGHALIDVVRAAHNLPEAGLSAEAPVVVRGYSQGGGAAMWAGELQPTYAPELDLLGIAAGGVPADLALVGLPLEGSDGFGFFLYSILGQDIAYPDLSLEPHLNETGRAEIARMQSEVCTLDLILDFAGHGLFDYVTTSPFDVGWLGRLAENKLGSHPINVPVFQYHESADGLVAFGQAETLRNTYCAQDVELTWRSYDTGGATGLIRHINLVYRGNGDVNQFIEDRIAGDPGASNC